MARPTLDSVSMTNPAWYSIINENFRKLFEEPYPMPQLTGTTVGDGNGETFDQDARLFDGCGGIKDGIQYRSNGTAWDALPNNVLTYVADLDTGTATITDIKDAYNAILADMRNKEWMV